MIMQVQEQCYYGLRLYSRDFSRRVIFAPTLHRTPKGECAFA